MLPPGGASGRYAGGSVALRCQLNPPGSRARVDLTHLADRPAWAPKPLASGWEEGRILCAVVLPPGEGEAPGEAQPLGAPLEISLRPSCIEAARAAAARVRAAAAAAAAAPAPAPAPAGDKRKRAAPAAAPAPAAASEAAIAAAATRAAAEALRVMEAEERAAASAVGALVSGYVVSSGPKGVFLRCARGLTARVLLRLLSDDFVGQPAGSFPPGRLATGVVTAADAPAGRLEMSLRRSDVAPAAPAPPAAGWAQLRPGRAAEGRVTKVDSFGVFVALEGTDRGEAPGAKPRRARAQRTPISGLVHVSEVEDPPAGGEKKAAGALARLRGELGARFAVGDRVRVALLSVDVAARKVALSMRPSRLQAAAKAEAEEEEEEGEAEDGEEDEEDEEEEEEDEEDEEKDEEGEDEEGEDEEDEEEDAEGEEAEEEEEGDEAEEEEEDDDVAPVPPARRAARGAGIFAALDAPLSAGAAPSLLPAARRAGERAGADGAPAVGAPAAPELDDADAFGDGDSEEGVGGGGGGGAAAARGAGRGARARAAAAEEAETARREARMASGAAEASPETVEDFERLVAGTPQEALAWIRYMAWALSVSDTARARGVAERALGVLSFRAEAPRLAVWTALLNLEASFGTPASLAAVFARAVAGADPRAVHSALLGVLARGGPARAEEAAALHALTAKKFGRDLPGGPDVWRDWAAFLFRGGQAPAARALLPRALLALPKHAHPDAILRFALLEYEHAAGAEVGGGAAAAAASGLQERGRTMLQGLLDALPKRLDIWSVFLDQEIAALARRAAATTPAARRAAAKAGGDPDLAFVRSIFDRALSLKMSSKKARFLFKRYLAFEGEHGDPAGVARVQEQAQAYVTAILATAPAGGAGSGGE